jgi:hypothetical protein
MNPAQLQVSIEADMKALEAQFDGIERAFLAAGQRAAKAFRGEVGMVMSEDVGDKAVAPIARAVSRAVHEGVERATERMRPVGVRMGTAVGRAAAPVLAKEATGLLEREFSDRKLGQIFGQVVGIGMADKAMRSLADAIRGDKTLGEAFADALSSTPVIGAAFDIGRAISDSLAEALGGGGRSASLQRMIDLDYERNMIAENKAHEEKVALEQKRIEEARAADAKREKDRVDGIMRTGQVTSRLERELAEKNLDFEAEYRAANARAAGDEEAALTIEMEREIQKERNRIYDQYGADERGGLIGSAEEQDAFQKVLADAENLIRDQFAYKKYLRKQEADEEKRIAAAAHAERMEQIRVEIEERQRVFEEERRAAQSAGVGSASTALGAFSFDAYPAADKKRNDERMVKALESIKAQALSGGFS